MNSTVAIQRDHIESLQWFLFRVKPNTERTVQAGLVKHGIDAIVPEVTYNMRQRHSRKRVVRSYPALRSALLVGFESGPVPFRKVLDAPHVHGVVGFSSFAARIRGSDVYDFITNPKLDKTGLYSEAVFVPDYVTGDTVLLSDGLMTGFKGTVVHTAGRVTRVLVPDFMGRSCEVDVRVDHAAKAA